MIERKATTTMVINSLPPESYDCDFKCVNLGHHLVIDILGFEVSLVTIGIVPADILDCESTLI